jgi:hypothetical protein
MLWWWWRHPFVAGITSSFAVNVTGIQSKKRDEKKDKKREESRHCLLLARHEE